MKLNVQFVLVYFFLCVLGLPVVQTQDTASNDEEVKDKAMDDHVIKEILTNVDISCRIKCHMIPRCVSYNVGPSSTPGMMRCQLSDVDRHQYPQDYLDRPGYTYGGIKKPCASSLDKKNTRTYVQYTVPTIPQQAACIYQ